MAGQHARAIVPVPFTLVPDDATDDELQELAAEVADALDIALAEQGAVRLYPPVQVTDPDELARLEATLPEAMQGTVAQWWYADGARGNRQQRRELARALNRRRRAHLAAVSSTDDSDSTTEQETAP